MVENCCYVMPLDTGSLLLGVFTLILSVTMGIYSVVLLSLESSSPRLGADHLKLMMHLDFDSKAVKTVLSIIVLVQVLWMIFSILLIVGIKKNRPSYLLGYFSFGIVMAIMMMLSGLLVLLKQHWIMASIQFIAAAIYMHGLVVVHHCYELMQQGNVFGEGHWKEDEDQLWRPDDDETDPAL